MQGIIEVDELSALKAQYDELKEKNKLLMDERNKLIFHLNGMKDKADKYEALYNLMVDGKLNAEKRLRQMQEQSNRTRRANNAEAHKRETMATVLGLVAGFVVCAFIVGMIVTKMNGWW